MNKKRKIFIIFGIILTIWLGVGIIDFGRVHSFEKTIFCINTKAQKDGGSGHYVGIGYSFDIEGNFMPEDELKGVTEYSYYLFGIRVQSSIKD